MTDMVVVEEQENEISIDITQLINEYIYIYIYITEYSVFSKISLFSTDLL